MNSSNNNTYTQHQRIEWKYSGLSEKCNYLEHKKSSCCPQEKPRTEGLGNSIQIYSQTTKRYRRLFSIQEKVLNKNIHKTVGYCKRKQSFHSTEIVATQGKKNGSIKGIFSCGSSHCPVCFNRIAESKRKELKKVIEYSKNNSMRIAMMTLTFSHQFGNDLEKICDALSKAKTYFMRQRKFQKLNIQWHISRLEFTYSNKNGFHPHYHIAMGIENVDEVIWSSQQGTQRELQIMHSLKIEWMRCCKKFGLECIK